ncbi:GGDEF domain-containing phosphodiesterase [Lichenifustis flavocetrariae]|uniref:GGDEF domain-containing phosphodiesterase n=1 Tax=Lichenifustis flavocetrariae TaxID=2949735 RepID=A0AA41Z1E3_9HYPH|nr:GGDEF domain-containing phosphodiesterase [Lichenifustis flavocetrariae]MCW6511070.1 GGDEF domain-containing phosphodiesterase [Lichenifustis flavocetrariae]
MRRATDHPPALSTGDAGLDPQTFAILRRTEATDSYHGLIAQQFCRTTLLGLLPSLLETARRDGKLPVLMLVHAAPPGRLGLGAADVEEEFRFAVAEALCRALRDTDIVMRHSAFCFAILLADAAPTEAAHVADRLASVLAETGIPTSVGVVTAKVSIGAATTAAGDRDAAAVVGRAETALDQARASGRHVILEAPAFLRRGELREQAVAEEIIVSLDESRLQLAFQPIVVASTRALFCHEALSRLCRPDGTLVSPADFFPVAERTGLVQRIDRRVLDLALAHLEADPQARLSVNLSMRSAQDAAWMEAAFDSLTQHGAAASRLIVEITETAAIDDLAVMAATVKRLKACGVRVAMDDFGAGFSSFRNLRDLTIDLLKIDGAFVRDLAQSPDDAVFVRTLVGLAKHLGIPVVAEYVETEETAELLTGWGVDYLQGHLIGAALPLPV